MIESLEFTNLKPQASGSSPKRFGAWEFLGGVVVLFSEAPMQLPVAVGVHTAPILALTKLPPLHYVPPVRVLHRNYLQQHSHVGLRVGPQLLNISTKAYFLVEVCDVLRLAD